MVIEVRGLTDLFAAALGIDDRRYTGLGKVPYPVNETGRLMETIADRFNVQGCLRVEINAFPEELISGAACEADIRGMEDILRLAALLAGQGFATLVILAFGRAMNLKLVVVDGSVRLFEPHSADGGSYGVDTGEHAVFHDEGWDDEDDFGG